MDKIKSIWRNFLTKTGKISRNKYFNFILGICLYTLLYSGLKPLFLSDLCIARGISIFLVFLTSYIKEYKVNEKWFKLEVDSVSPLIMDLGGFVGVIFSFISYN